jgi:Fe-S cluster biogenesis protein NfuA
VANDKDFQQRVQRISSLVSELDSMVDPAARAAAKQLLQLVMELHGTGLERMLEVISQAGDSGSYLIDQFGRDPLVSSLLVLYGLHPDDVATRVTRAVERLQPSLRKQGAELELLGIDDAGVRLRVGTNGHSCGSTTQTLKATVEGAIYDAAPDVGAVVVEGLEEKAASTFISIDKLIGGPMAMPAAVPQSVVHVSDSAD